MEANPLGLLDPNSYRVAETANPFVTERSELGREEFLQLLVAQLENQNPLDPQGDTEFIAQLATFSSLEQLIDLNTRIDDVLAGQVQLVNSQALNLIGRDVLVGSQGTLQLTEAGADEIVFDLAEARGSVQVEIYDGSGARVRQIELGARDAGRHSVHWDGADESGDALKPGTYEFRISGTTASGEQKSIAGFISLPVEGIHIGEGGLSLVSGNQVIDFSRIVEIRMPGAEPAPVEAEAASGLEFAAIP